LGGVAPSTAFSRSQAGFEQLRDAGDESDGRRQTKARAAGRLEHLDWLLIINRRHLKRALCVFVDHYYSHRPHRSLHLAPPAPNASELRVIRSASADVKRRDRLGGLIHEYCRAA
jgi:hypothetical protein